MLIWFLLYPWLRKKVMCLYIFIHLVPLVCHTALESQGWPSVKFSKGWQNFFCFFSQMEKESLCSQQQKLVLLNFLIYVVMKTCKNSFKNLFQMYFLSLCVFFVLSERTDRLSHQDFIRPPVCLSVCVRQRQEGEHSFKVMKTIFFLIRWPQTSQWSNSSGKRFKRKFLCRL